MKITLMMDFLQAIRKNTYVPCHEKPPDPNVIDELRGHVKWNLSDWEVNVSHLYLYTGIYIFIHIEAKDRADSKGSMH